MLGELEASLRLGLATRVLANYRVPIKPQPETCQVDWVSGCCIMLRREALERAGLFDEDFFLYYEEIDLCRRLHEAGYGVHYLPHASVEHREAQATGITGSKRRPRYWHESRRLYYEKHHGRAYFLVATALHVAGGSFDRLRCTLSRRSPTQPPHFLRDMVESALHSRTGNAIKP
jgi:GT2 family glycosyltransferase